MGSSAARSTRCDEATSGVSPALGHADGMFHGKQ
jgi:hypothetical protein